MPNNAKTLKDNIHDGADAAMKSASHAAGVVKDTVRDLASDVSAQASDTAAAMRDSAVDTWDDARDALSDSGDRLAETLRRAANDPAESIQGRVLSAVAGGVSSAASTLRDRNMSEIVADIRALAGRNPGAFAAGAAVAGFALARFLRASAASDRTDRRS